MLQPPGLTTNNFWQPLASDAFSLQQGVDSLSWSATKFAPLGELDGQCRTESADTLLAVRRIPTLRMSCAQVLRRGHLTLFVEIVLPLFAR